MLFQGSFEGSEFSNLEVGRSPCHPEIRVPGSQSLLSKQKLTVGTARRDSRLEKILPEFFNGESTRMQLLHGLTTVWSLEGTGSRYSPRLAASL